MPSIGEITLSKVRVLCETTERLLKPPVLSDPERAALHASDVDPAERTKDDWWKRYAEVRSFSRRKERWVPDVGGGTIEEGPLMEVLESTPVEVHLSDGTVRRVRAASWDRVMAVEDLWFWMAELEKLRFMLQNEEDLFTDRDALLNRTRAELTFVKGWMYAQVCAPTPPPIEMPEDEAGSSLQPPDWTENLTQLDHTQLLDAWLTVHVVRPKRAEGVIRMKYPLAAPEGGEAPRGSLAGFPFMMASVAYREKRSPEYVKRDRALTEVVATYMAQAQQSGHVREEAKQKADAKAARDKSTRASRSGR